MEEMYTHFNECRSKLIRNATMINIPKFRTLKCLTKSHMQKVDMQADRTVPGGTI